MHFDNTIALLSLQQSTLKNIIALLSLLKAEHKSNAIHALKNSTMTNGERNKFPMKCFRIIGEGFYKIKLFQKWLSYTDR